MKLAAFHSVRVLERALPLPLLGVALGPLAYVATLREASLRRELAAGLMRLSLDGQSRADCARLIFAERYHYNLSRFINCCPDRLASPIWRNRFEMPDALWFAKDWPAGRPVVLATLHAGRMHMLHYALRAHGVPAAMLIKKPSHMRTAIKPAKDQLSPGPQPVVFSRDELKASQVHLRAGNPLIVAVDMPSPSMQTCPFGRGNICISTGAARMAVASNAIIVACLLIQTGPWQFALRLGSSISNEGDVEPINRQLCADFAHMLRDHPQQCGWEVFNSLQ